MKNSIVAIFGLLTLSACTSDTVKDTLGLDRSVPDEFRVVSRPPLSMPPQFSLRPPANSDVSPNQLPADQKAQSLLGGKAGSATIDSKSKGSTGAESQFLKNAGANVADPRIRTTLGEEKYAVQTKKEESSWWNFWSGDDKPDPVVDSKKEAQRLKTNADEGKPVTAGDTPEVKPSEQGLLDSIVH